MSLKTCSIREDGFYETENFPFTLEEILTSWGIGGEEVDKNIVPLPEGFPDDYRVFIQNNGSFIVCGMDYDYDDDDNEISIFFEARAPMPTRPTK